MATAGRAKPAAKRVSSKGATKPKATAQRKPPLRRQRKPPMGLGDHGIDLAKHGAVVWSVVKGDALIMLPAAVAQQLFAGPLEASGPMDAVDAAEREIAALRERDPEMAGSMLAASLLVLARELDNPLNSATSKGICSKVFGEHRAELLKLAPQPEPKDELDGLRSRRAARLAAG